MPDNFSYFFPLQKADEEKRLVWGRAAVEEPDKSREIMDYVTAKPEFQKWSDGYSKATLGKSYGNIRSMHNPKHLAGKVAEIVYNDEAKAVDICVKVLDPVDWAKVEEGGYTGFSIGGGYVKKWADQASGCTRYTPRIQEISFVDSPCIPSARIMEMQKQDGSLEEVLLKGTPRTFRELLPPPGFADLRKGAVGELAGNIGGDMIGSSIGTAVGALTPVPGGAAIGSLVGGAIGGAVGGKAGADLTSSAAKPVSSRIATLKAPKSMKVRMRVPHAFKVAPDGGMEKALGAAAAKAGLAVGRHLAHVIVPKYAGMAAGLAAAKAGHKLGGKIGAKLAARRLRLGIVRSDKPGIIMRRLSPRQQQAVKDMTSPAMVGAATGALAGMAVGHHIAAGATGHADRKLRERFGRPPGPTDRAPWETRKSAVSGVSMMKRSNGDLEKGILGTILRGTGKAILAPGKYGAAVGERIGSKVGQKVGRAAMSRGVSPIGAVNYATRGAKLGSSFGRHAGNFGTSGLLGSAASLAIPSRQQDDANKQQRRGDLEKGIGSAIMGGVTRAMESGAGKKIISGLTRARSAATSMASSAMASPVGQKVAAAGTRALNSPVGAQAVKTAGKFGQTIAAHPRAATAALATGAAGYAMGQRRGRAEMSGKQEPRGRMNKIIAPLLLGGAGALLAGKAGAKLGARAAARGLNRRILSGTASHYDLTGAPVFTGAGIGGLGGFAGGAGGGIYAGRKLENRNGKTKKQGPRGGLEKGWRSSLASAAINTTKKVGGFAGRGAWSVVRGAPGAVADAGNVVGSVARKMPKTAVAAAAGGGYMLGRRKSGSDADAYKQELIARLRKNILLQDDNTVSQWKQARSDEWEPKPYWTVPKDPNSPKTVMQGMPAQQYGPSGGIITNLFGKGENPYSGLAKKASAAEQEKIHQTMHEFKHGKLHSFRSDLPKRKMPKVTDRKQAIAIAMSQARRMGKGDGLMVAVLADRLTKNLGAISDVGGTVGAGIGSLAHSVQQARQAHKTNKQIGQLSTAEHAQRIAAARARWKKEMPHVDMDQHHRAVEDWAGKAIFGRTKKIARAKQEAEHFWHNVADAHAAHDKMRPHIDKKASIVMHIPGTAGIVHNPDGIGAQHFTRHGIPTKTIYMMHPDEVDDWVRTHGKKDTSLDMPLSEAKRHPAMGPKLAEIDEHERRAALHNELNDKIATMPHGPNRALAEGILRQMMAGRGHKLSFERVGKRAPSGLIEHFDQLNEALDLSYDLEKVSLGSIAEGALRGGKAVISAPGNLGGKAGLRIGAAIGSRNARRAIAQGVPAADANRRAVEAAIRGHTIGRGVGRATGVALLGTPTVAAAIDKFKANSTPKRRRNAVSKAEGDDAWRNTKAAVFRKDPKGYRKHYEGLNARLAAMPVSEAKAKAFDQAHPMFARKP